MMLLQNKTAIITGASKGIGKAIAETFAEHGAELILLSRNIETLTHLKEELSQKYSCKCHVYQCDVSDINSIKEVFGKLNENKLVADILVNNAGVMIDATLQMVKPEQVEKIFSTNVYGTMYCTQLAIKMFLKKRGGSVINLSSIIGTNGNLGQSIYGASKASVIGFTTSMSKELAPLNIRVNALAPGFIDTDMTKGMNEKFYQKNLESIGMRRVGKPEDVSKVALFLASDLSGYVTGQVIGVDGGMVI